jgi:hypothetical protein
MKTEADFGAIMDSELYAMGPKRYTSTHSTADVHMVIGKKDNV